MDNIKRGNLTKMINLTEENPYRHFLGDDTTKISFFFFDISLNIILTINCFKHLNKNYFSNNYLTKFDFINIFV